LTEFDTRPNIFASGQQTIIPQAGPLARSVADLTLAMSVLAAPGLDRIDPSIPPMPWRNPADLSVPGLRIAMYTDDGYFKASPAIRRVVEEAANALRAAGTQVEPWTPPDVSQASCLFFSILTSDGANAYKHAVLHGSHEPARL
jgi:Asp-tRNA(Asn)/Glu-tRNA(Gln) amidotransferase A subunit family amidase